MAGGRGGEAAAEEQEDGSGGRHGERGQRDGDAGNDAGRRRAVARAGALLRPRHACLPRPRSAEAGGRRLREASGAAAGGPAGAGAAAGARAVWMMSGTTPTVSAETSDSSRRSITCMGPTHVGMSPATMRAGRAIAAVRTKRPRWPLVWKDRVSCSSEEVLKPSLCRLCPCSRASIACVLRSSSSTEFSNTCTAARRRFWRSGQLCPARHALARAQPLRLRFAL